MNVLRPDAAIPVRRRLMNAVFFLSEESRDFWTWKTSLSPAQILLFCTRSSRFLLRSMTRAEEIEEVRTVWKYRESLDELFPDANPNQSSPCSDITAPLLSPQLMQDTYERP